MESARFQRQVSPRRWSELAYTQPWRQNNLSKLVIQWLLVEEAASLQMWQIIVIVTLFTGHVQTARIAPLEHLATKKGCALYLAEPA